MLLLECSISDTKLAKKPSHLRLDAHAESHGKEKSEIFLERATKKASLTESFGERFKGEGFFGCT